MGKGVTSTHRHYLKGDTSTTMLEGKPAVGALRVEGIEKVAFHKELLVALRTALDGSVQAEGRVEQHIGVHDHIDPVAGTEQPGHHQHIDRESPEAYKQATARPSDFIQPIILSLLFPFFILFVVIRHMP